MSGGWKRNPQPTRNASRISRFGSSRASSCTSQFWVSSPVPSCGSTKCNVFNIPWLAWCSICCIYAVLNPPPTIAPQNPTSLFSWEYVVLVTLQGHTWHKCSHLPTCPFKCMCTSLMFWIPNMTLNSTGSCLLPMSNDEMGFSWSSFHLEGGGEKIFRSFSPYIRGERSSFSAPNTFFWTIRVFLKSSVDFPPCKFLYLPPQSSRFCVKSFLIFSSFFLFFSLFVTKDE